MGIEVPVEYGGAGLTFPCTVLAIEGAAHGQGPSLALTVPVASACARGPRSQCRVRCPGTRDSDVALLVGILSPGVRRTRSWSRCSSSTAPRHKRRATCRSSPRSVYATTPCRTPGRCPGTMSSSWAASASRRRARARTPLPCRRAPPVSPTAATRCAAPRRGSVTRARQRCFSCLPTRPPSSATRAFRALL